ncbi:LysR family transcriptional regulator [Thalassospira lucentensis]|uniref:LysR family transcriptional regulator n=1 Tax=Thalassospira lucentensis TaxID=168935 RepID=UPI0003B4E32E|nr:LysR family transcriptional regulator [Thalassospira lucentensis]RCK24756.1 LysR family transcriptional regulator [Thalassospira lucentensis MCCC 1A00383 = DSM 14000]
MNLEQLIAVDAVVSTGTFRGAADRLNKAQSAISHQVRKLEDELGFAIFSREDYRPRLSSEGEVFLREATRVLDQFRKLQATAQELRSTQEPLVRVTLTATISLEPILKVLGQIGDKFPNTHIAVATEMMGGPLARLMKGDADLIVAGLEGVEIDHVETTPVGSVVIRPVAHRSFAVAQRSGMRSRMEMQSYVQVIVSGTGGPDYDQTRDVLAGGRRWTVSDFATKKSIIMNGHGWGGLPEHMITDELKSGELVVLNIEGFRPRHTEVFAIRRRDQTMGRVMGEIWRTLQMQAGAT